MEDAKIEWKVVVSEMFAENAYLVHLQGRTDCLIVDPGFDDQLLIEAVTRNRLQPVAILNTHGHADHIAGNAACKRRWPDIPLVIGRQDAPKLTDARLNLSAVYGFGVTSPAADATVVEGDCYQAAGMDWDVLETPGHSIGHVVFVCRQASPWLVLGGDVLFQGSVGRTDFPDGSHQQLIAAIESKLLSLPDDTIVLPGHGPAITIGEERRTNPFLQ